MAGYSVTTPLVCIAAFGLTACQPKQAETLPESPVFSTLEGTSWQLVEFQSMDDAQGTSRPAKPENYTITFGKDGQLSAKLDCNRGVGSWKNEISNATGGSLAIGPLGVTKMLCPAPSMGNMLEKQLGYVRSFIVKDDKLYMSLMADGGIIAWEPLRETK